LSADDAFDLSRFVRAQDENYADALAEVAAGRKRSHWMWYVFPQFAGLGTSETSQYFAIKTLAEARAYLDHPILGPRLTEIAEAAAALSGRSARDIFGSPDDVKLRSSATLFAAVSPPESVFARLLDRYFDGRPDQATLRLIEQESRKP
jgi:uncharacterized protein (DUF1810 family)